MYLLLARGCLNEIKVVVRVVVCVANSPSNICYIVMAPSFV